MFANLGRRRPTLGLAAGHAVCAALGVLLFWGFTVDDALVTARVAWRLSRGVGYRFNASGPAVDAVTPLGWVYLLVPFARVSPLGALNAARYLGAFSWIAAATWLGSTMAREGKRLNWSALLLLVAPLGAWASAGMETGLVMALGATALVNHKAALLVVGVLAALRPELVPFCAILGLHHYWLLRATTRRAFFYVLIPLASCVFVALVRKTAFGSAVPLAAMAKPSDAAHGFRYSLGALLLTGPAWAWLGRGWARLDAKSRWLAVAVLVHFATLVVAGGDWMPLWRLAVPVLPAMLWVAHGLVSQRSTIWQSAAGFVGLAIAAVIGWKVGLPARHVMQARQTLIGRAAPLLNGAQLVAGLDIGWLGVATQSDILDLAGITDTRVAALPGGHTTKKIPNSLFDFRKPDALVLLSAPAASLAPVWTDTPFARGVENHVANLDYWQDCSVRGTVPLQHTRQFYVIVRCH